MFGSQNIKHWTTNLYLFNQSNCTSLKCIISNQSLSAWDHKQSHSWLERWGESSRLNCSFCPIWHSNVSGPRVSASKALPVVSSPLVWHRQDKNELLLAETAWGQGISLESSFQSLVNTSRHPSGTRQDRAEAPWERDTPLPRCSPMCTFPSCLWKEGWESRTTHSVSWLAPTCQTKQEPWTATGKRNSPFNVLWFPPGKTGKLSACLKYLH